MGVRRLRTGSMRGAALGVLVVAATLGASASAPASPALRTAVDDLDAAAATLATERRTSSAGLKELAPTLRRTTRSMRQLDATLPVVRQLVQDLLPGLKRGAKTVEAARGWTAAARRLVAENALPAWTRELRPTIPELARLSQAGHRIAPSLDALTQCVTKVLVPAANVKIEDGRFTTGHEVYRSLGPGLAGLRSVLRGGAEPALRVQPGLGPNLLDFGPLGGQGTLLAAAARVPIGVRPVRPAARPPLRDDRACAKQPVPDPNAAPAVRGDAAARVSPTRSVAAREGTASDDEAANRGLTRDGDLAGALVQRLNPLRVRPPATRSGKQR